MEDTTIEDTLKTVGELYAKKDFNGALRELETHKSDISEGLWHYNMGTVQAGLQNYPLARFHLLKAEATGFISSEVLQNLELVEGKLEVSRLEKPLGLSDYLIKGSLYASDGLLTTLALVIFLVGMINLRKTKNLKKLALLAVSVLIVLGINFWIRSWPMSIVTAPQAVMDGPSGIFSAKEEIPSGVLVISKPDGEWRKIVYPSRFQGWIKNTGLKELK